MNEGERGLALCCPGDQRQPSMTDVAAKIRAWRQRDKALKQGCAAKRAEWAISSVMQREKFFVRNLNMHREHGGQLVESSKERLNS